MAEITHGVLTMMIRYRCPLWTCALLAAGVSGCAIPLSELDLPQDVAGGLPAPVALDFLMSIPPVNSSWPECRFGPEGVQVAKKGKIVKMMAYRSLLVHPRSLGQIEVYYPNDYLAFYCWVGMPAQKSHMKMDTRRFIRKTLTALLALGAQLPPVSTATDTKVIGP